MKTFMVFAIIFFLSSDVLCKRKIKSYRFPCINHYGYEGFCVPAKKCCGVEEDNSLAFDSGDKQNCTRNEFCCTSGSILCQSCYLGTKKVNKTCVDINECEENYGLCSGHKCINSYGDYTCECFESFQMIGNLKTCQHINQSESVDLLFSATRTINLMQLNRINKNEEHIQMIYSGTITPKSIDYSFSGNYIAWTDITLNQINIAPINDKNPSFVKNRIIMRFIKNPICVSIDWIHNLLYWIDLETRTINVVNIFRPNDYYVVINISDQEPNDLLINVIENHIVWNHIGLKPRIMRSYQDGNNQSVLYSTYKQIFCITIDIILKRYYFIDIEDFALNSIDFEGKDAKIIIVSRNLINSINSMSIYFDDIFMSTNDLVFKMNKFDRFDTHNGGKPEALIKSLMFNEDKAFIIDNVTNSYRKEIFSAKIIDPLLQQELENKCQFAKCSHLCLPSDKNNIFRCLCPINTILVDSSDCIEKRFKDFVIDSLNWETDLQKLIDYSMRKSIGLRELLNQSFAEQKDLNKLFNNSFRETMKLKQLFNYTSKQSLEMKRSLVLVLNETLFWRKVLNLTFNNKIELEKLLNYSIHTNNFTEVMMFINDLAKNDHSVQTQYIPETRIGEQVILSFILIGIFFIVILFLLIGYKLKIINFDKTSYSSSHIKPLYRKSQEMESRT